MRRALLAAAILIVPTIGRAQAAPLGEVLVLTTGSTIASRADGCLVTSAASSCSVDAADVQRELAAIRRGIVKRDSACEFFRRLIKGSSTLVRTPTRSPLGDVDACARWRHT